MRVHIEPSGEDAIVRTDSIYTLTKTIGSTWTKQPFHVETIDFHAGESKAFSSGTVVPAKRRAGASGVREPAQGIARRQLAVVAGREYSSRSGPGACWLVHIDSA
jgi:hypothetical protein